MTAKKSRRVSGIPTSPGTERMKPTYGSSPRTSSNPFNSLARRFFLLAVGPATAFLAFSILFYLGAGDYDYTDSGVPTRIMSVRSR